MMEIRFLKRYERPASGDEVEIIDALIEDAKLCPCPAHVETIAVLGRYREMLKR